MSFSELALDPKLLRALEKRKFTRPTPVQAECIKQALEGKDIVARARTGSGKTLAYVLPALHKLLALPAETQGMPWQVLILVPTRELSEQVKEETECIVSAGGLGIRVTALTASGAAQRDQFLRAGAVVVATPGRIAQALKESKLRCQMLEPNERQKRPGLSSLVVDEADLILSMPGYEEDLREIAPKVPRSCQCLLMSATTNESIDRLQKLVLHNAITLDLLSSGGSEGSADAAAIPGPGPGSATDIEHFALHCGRVDKLLHVMALLKLGLVKRKVLLFVNSVDGGFRLRLFLESFGIRSAVINAELPMNSRHHILQEFNRGMFDYLIATDDPKREPSEEPGRGGKGKKRKRTLRDEEFGVTRGIDFKGVETVINVDVPDGVTSYVHRVGRTGRAGNAGVALSLFTPEDAGLEAELASRLQNDVAADGEGEAQPSGCLTPFSKLTAQIVEALRYRAEDISRALTSKVVREARAKELRLELLNSQRLERHFQEHPGDLALLKHDKALARKPEAPHLKHLPSYLRASGMPATLGPGGVLSTKKRRKHNKGVDPIKGGFMKAPKKGGASEPLTAMERQAQELGEKLAKKERRKQGKAGSFVPKRNVRKKR